MIIKHNANEAITMNWNIDRIEALTEAEASSMALDTMQIKEHNVYFIDFGGYFKFSALVFADGRHIHFANEYELHWTHMNLDHDGLKAKFIKALNHKLFTEAEIVSPIASYVEYNSKSHFLHNYYGMRREYVTVFCINPTDEQQKQFECKTKDMTYDPVSFAYYDDADFVKHHCELYMALEASYDAMLTDYDFLKSAFVYEMANHEYAINWQGNWDVLRCFGNIKYDHKHDDQDLTFYFDQLKFNDMQRKAYMEARHEYMQKHTDM